VAGERVIPVRLDGKETISPAANKAGAALERLGDKAEEAARDANKLDDEIEDLSRSLVGLAAAYAAAGTAEERADIGKSMRGQQSQLRQLTNVRKLLKGAGEDGAADFSIGFIAKVGPLLARAPLSPPIAGAIAAGAPVIASAVAGAVTLGVASAAVGAGIRIAFKDPAVKAAGEELVDDLGGMLVRAAQPFAPETLRGIAIVRREILSIEDDVAGVFSDSSRYVAPFARGIGGFVRELAPGLRAAVRNAEPLIDLAQEHLPAMGKTLGDAFERLSRNADNTKNTLDATLTTLEGMVTVTSKLIEISNSDVGGIFTGAWIRELIASGSGGTKVLKDMSASTSELAVGMATATDVARSFREGMEAITNAALSAEQAEITWAESVRDTTAAIKDNNAEIKNKNERDLANRQLLVDMAQVGMRRVDAIREETEATQGAAEAEAAAAAVYATTRAELVRAATAYLGSAAAAEKYVTEVLGIPPTRTTLVTAETAEAERRLKTVGDLIAAIKSKRVVITTVNNVVTVRSEGRNVPVGELGGREFGGPVRKNHAYVVGEKRAEVFVPDRDGTIIPSIDRYQQMTGRVPSMNAPAGAGDAERLALAIGRAMARELRDLPIYRVPDAARQADVWRRAGTFA
jgi:hypothetical protein